MGWASPGNARNKRFISIITRLSQITRAKNDFCGQIFSVDRAGGQPWAQNTVRLPRIFRKNRFQNKLHYPEALVSLCWKRKKNRDEILSEFRMFPTEKNRGRDREKTSPKYTALYRRKYPYWKPESLIAHESLCIGWFLVYAWKLPMAVKISLYT